MKHAPIIVTLSALLLVAPAVALGAGEPVSFRSFTLGMTTGKFKQLPFPDSSSAGIKNIQPYCTGDAPPKGAKFFLSTLDGKAEDRRAGLGRCAYFYRDHGTLYEIAAGLGNDNGGDTKFLFYKSPNSPDAQLFTILVTFPARLFDDVVEALRAKYGPAQTDMSGTVQNGFGARLSSRGLQWKRGGATITLVERSGRLDTSKLLLIDDQLNSAADAALKDARGIKGHL